MARLRSIRRQLVRFGQIDTRQRMLLAEALVFLLLTRLALTFIPFPRLAEKLGTFLPPEQAQTIQTQIVPRIRDAEIARDIGWAVTRAARNVPVGAVCLPQAMAARIMLARRGVKSVLHFGVAKSTAKRIDAHAWLDAAGVEVTGFPVGTNFAEIACFA